MLGIIIITTYKNDPGSKIHLGVCDHSETKLLQCIMEQKENIHIVIGWGWQQHHRHVVFLTLSYADGPLGASLLLLSLLTSLWKMIPQGTAQQIEFGKTTSPSYFCSDADIRKLFNNSYIHV